MNEERIFEMLERFGERLDRFGEWLGQFASENLEGFDYFLILAGLMSVIYVPLDYRSDARKIKRRSAVVSGKVVGHQRRSSYCSVSRSHFPPTQHAVVVYEVDGKEYRCVSGKGASYIMHPLGIRLNVTYNPKKPGDAAVEAPVTESKLKKVFSLYLVPVLGLCLLGFVALKHWGISLF
jgi:hypothetical protein